VLDLVTRQVLEMSGADLAALALPEGEHKQLVLRHAAGENAAQAVGLVLPDSSLSAKVLASGEPVTVADFSHDTRVAPVAREHLGLGPSVIFPLGSGRKVRGVLTVGRSPGSLPLAQPVVELVGSFAAQAAVALELADARRDAEQVTVLQDRDRIARDLHDLVIQRLYATGMSLQGAMPLISRPDVAERVSRAVDAMDDTISEIRSAIFALQARPETKEPSTREQILQIIDEITGPLGFAPSVRLVGDLAENVPADTARQMLTALREGLSNAARHAAASRVDVSIEANGSLVLMVRDDGRGLTGSTRRSGLANLAQRAEQLGGEMRVGPAAGGGGTELRWQVPLP
jgi:signal transduction histidine kinase